MKQFVNEHNLITLRLLSALSASPYEEQTYYDKIVFIENAEKTALLSLQNLLSLENQIQACYNKFNINRLSES